MLGLSLLPWDYGIRNLLRRPLRTALTLAALTLVLLLVLLVIGFLRGLERSLEVSGDPEVTIVYSIGMGENLEYSSIPMRSRDLLAASLDVVRTYHDQRAISPELFLGSEIELGEERDAAIGLLRGTTASILLVRNHVQIDEGNWPKPGEVLVGRLAATKLGVEPGTLAVGETLRFEGKDWRISGRFSATGSAFESEIWCRLDDLQQALKRQDLSMVALRLESADDFAEVDLFCKERPDLELQAIPEVDYYASLQKDYRPIRVLAWLVVLLVSTAGTLIGLNTMHGAVVGRMREFATLQTLGYSRRAILLSLIQENVVLAAAASLLATALGLTFVNGVALRFTMGAFTLRIDNYAVLIACGVGFLLGVVGAIVPALRTFRTDVVDGLRTV